jgi:hypothetical protein
MDRNIYPSDSASQINDTQERDIRFSDALTEEPEEELTQESQADIATRLRDNVVSYRETCAKLTKLLAATRDLRKERKILEKKLITDMSLLDVENLKLREGELRAKRSMPKVPLTKSTVISALTKNLQDPEMVDTIMDILYNKRDRYEKVELAHYSKKQK